MTIAVYKPFALVPPSGNAITQLDALPFDFGLSDASYRQSGSQYPLFTGSHMADPSCMFETTQIKDILDYCSTSLVCAGATGSNFDIEFQAMQNLNTRFAKTATEHLRVRMTETLLYWDSISADNNAFAKINGGLCGISADGSTAPAAATSGVAIGATPVVQHLYTLGPVKITSTSHTSQFICVDSWKFNSGAQAGLKKKNCSGAPYMELAYIESFEPTATISTEDKAKVLSFGHGESISSITFFLRKKSQGGLNVADGTSQHIAISAVAGTVKPGADNEIKFQLHTFAVNTASAIS